MGIDIDMNFVAKGHIALLVKREKICKNNVLTKKLPKHINVAAFYGTTISKFS